MTPPELPDSNPWDIPNGLDLAFQRRFQGCQQGHAGLVLCNSPWLAEDVKNSTGYGEAAKVGVHLAALSYDADYCLSAGDGRFLKLVNPRLYSRLTFVLPCVDTVLDWLKNSAWPLNVQLYTSPPVVPTGTLETQRLLPRVYQGHNLSGPAALWLAWYMGCDPIRLAGCHCRMQGQLATWYDRDKLRELIPDPAERERHLAAARTVLPDTARKTVALVEAMRRDNVAVDWPGEKYARESAEQEKLPC